MTHVANVIIQSSQVDADLTDFPILVDLSDLPSSFWDVVANGGGDIRVFKSDGTTELAREVVSCATATDTGELWVKFSGTLSSSSNTTIQIHADGSSANYAVGATYGRNAVWSNYIGVYHLVGGSLVDSTGTKNINVTSGALSAATDGPFAGNTGALFEAGDRAQAFDTNVIASADPDPFSVQAWFKPSSSDFRILEHQFNWWLVADQVGANYFAQFDQSLSPAARSTGTLSAAWNSMYGVYNGGTDSAVSLNGTTEHVTLPSGDVFANATVQMNRLGAVGSVREARATVLVLSDSWISTEYNNHSSPGTFYTTEAVGGAAFQAAWARGSNVMIGGAP